MSSTVIGEWCFIINVQYLYELIFIFPYKYLQANGSLQL